jgi:hypothetical protein
MGFNSGFKGLISCRDEIKMENWLCNIPNNGLGR